MEESWYRSPGERWLEFLAMFVPAVALVLILRATPLWPLLAVLFGFIGGAAIANLVFRMIPAWRRIRFRTGAEAIRLDLRERERPFVLGAAEHAIRLLLLLAALVTLMAPLPEISIVIAITRMHPYIFGMIGVGLIGVCAHAGWRDEKHRRALPQGGLIGEEDDSDDC